MGVNQSENAFDDTLHKIVTKKESTSKTKKLAQEIDGGKETNMKKVNINPQVKGAIKAIVAVLFIIGLIATGWMLNDNFDATVQAKAKDLASKITR